MPGWGADRAADAGRKVSSSSVSFTLHITYYLRTQSAGNCLRSEKIHLRRSEKREHDDRQGEGLPLASYRAHSCCRTSLPERGRAALEPRQSVRWEPTAADARGTARFVRAVPPKPDWYGAQGAVRYLVEQQQRGATGTEPQKKPPGGGLLRKRIVSFRGL